MKALLKNIKPEIYEGIFLRNPESSDLGRKIFREGAYLIAEIGFDAFTFKKLGERIHSPESSIYRYFENKHKLMLYISSWYWAWIECRLIFETANLEDANQRLTKAIILLNEDTSDEILVDDINESIIKQILVRDFVKTFPKRDVYYENTEDFFQSYKGVIHRVAEIIKEINPNYFYPETLATNIVEGAMHQHFLKQHFKSITNYGESASPTDFFLNMVKSILNKPI